MDQGLVALVYGLLPSLCSPSLRAQSVVDPI